ncbi:hypothetical protein J1TS5_03620 [Paenibacillus macerans]|uniref:hypothetical protein n=1 Tax=Paenibacillus macerans TaxID=44252 RepID=UPI001B075E77|nr:hypothetical protein [Paenibacillus macerans]GIP08192.1 hypothetical protein J1TS5_03620 [Paenibacillus macerans]
MAKTIRKSQKSIVQPRKVNDSRNLYTARSFAGSSLISASRKTGGVMIIPPAPGTEEKIKSEMKQLRAQLKEKLGEERYDRRMKNADDFYKSLKHT